MMEMKAAVTWGVGEPFQIEDVELAAPLGCGIQTGAGDVTFNIQQELMGEAKSLIGIVEGDAIPKLFIPKLIEYYKDGRFPFDRLLKFYPFAEINRAFKESHEGKCIKAVLTME